MNTRDIRTLYEYSWWATRRILAAAALLSPAQFVAPTTHSFGSLRGTLVHILDSECGWRMLCQHNSLASFGKLSEEAFPDAGGLREAWSREETAMREYLGGLSDRDLAGWVRYTADGNKRERVLWHCLLHLVNHGTHHRSQAAAILKGHGSEPVSLDFTLFLNEHPQAPA